MDRAARCASAVPNPAFIPVLGSISFIECIGAMSTGEELAISACSRWSVSLAEWSKRMGLDKMDSVIEESKKVSVAVTKRDLMAAASAMISLSGLTW